MQACLVRMWMAALVVGVMSLSAFGQAGIITTYVGPQMPVDGDRATAPAIDAMSFIASDGAGGFYFASMPARVCRVTAAGKLIFVAGNGTSGFSGDGGPAISAQLAGARGLATDTAGNLFIADGANHRVRKVTPDGIISTVAGNGTSGFGGDGRPAVLAMLNYPISLAVDKAGNLYIAEYHNQRVRKVTPDGIISTIAGNGTFGAGGDGGPATSAQFQFIEDIAVDAAGNVFIAECLSRVRRVTPDGLIDTVAGNGNTGHSGDGGPATSAEIGYAVGLAVDAAGNLFICDYGYVRKVTPDGIISTVAGNGTLGYSGDGGPATAAQMMHPDYIAVDAAGNLFINDSSNQVIRKVAPNGVMSTVAGNRTAGYGGDGGLADSAHLYNPLGLAVDKSGNLLIADSGNGRIRKVTPDGIISTVAGNGIEGFSGDGGPAIYAQFSGLLSIAIDAADNIFVADAYNARIRKITPDGIITTVAGDGNPGIIGDGGPATSARLYWPFGIAVDTAGNLFIAETGSSRIRKVTPEGIISTVAGNGTEGDSGDGGPAIYAQLEHPYGVAVDKSGNLFIADMFNHRIRKVSPKGIISTIAGTGTDYHEGDGGPAVSAQLSYPQNVIIDKAGNLFIADSGNHRIRKVTPGGIISTVAGNGAQGFAGDGGPATSAAVMRPFAVAIDPAGNLYISQPDKDRIRKVANITSCSGLNLNSGGAAVCQTTEEAEALRVGYVKVSVNSGNAPYGTAVFRFRQNGTTVSEVGVPASPATSRARIFVEYRSGVNPLPGRNDSGTVDINTGIAIANNGSASANVRYVLRGLDGVILSDGNGTIPAGKHFAKFIDQLKDVASGFVLPPDFPSAVQYGSLEIASDQPISVTALRGTLNQRDEFLMTTTPVADLTKSAGYNPTYFPHFVDGDSYTTSLTMLNTSNRVENGTLQFLDNDGMPLAVTPVGGTSGSIFRYSIPVGGAFRFQTSASATRALSGSVRLMPDLYTQTPVASAVFSCNPAGILVSESGIPATNATTHARVYVDLSGNHNTGLAIANINTTAADIAIRAYRLDGTTAAAGSSQGVLSLAPGGHAAKFADQLIAGLPKEFTGVLDISSESPFAALTLRSLVNERNDFLMTAFPVADANRPAPSPIIFPHIADGGGYMTQFILISPAGAAGTTLDYFNQDGAPATF